MLLPAILGSRRSRDPNEIDEGTLHAEVVVRVEGIREIGRGGAVLYAPTKRTPPCAQNAFCHAVNGPAG